MNIKKPEVWMNGIDTILIDIENADSETKAWHLCPYSTKTVKQAFSHFNTKKRIKIVDRLILKGLKL